MVFLPPGPTWPNRFFVHGASSAGWAGSPSTGNIVGWETPGGGFTYPSGSSIFDALSNARMQWRVYVDENGPVLGGIPQVAALKGVTYLVNTNALTSLACDLQGPTRTPIRSSSQTTVMSGGSGRRARDTFAFL